jgi:hypothetical protein
MGVTTDVLTGVAVFISLGSAVVAERSRRFTKRMAAAVSDALRAGQRIDVFSQSSATKSSNVP